MTWEPTNLTWQPGPEPMTVYLFQDGPLEDTWCETCMLSTGFEVTLSMLGDSGIAMNVAALRGCRRCSQESSE